MKTRFFFLFPALSGIAMGLGLDWFTVDGGGGASAGGVYTLKGTTGQPDAGATMSGGTYTLDGGYWSAPESWQISEGPPLRVDRAAGGNVLVSWPAASPGWVLERSSDMMTWTPAGGTVVVQSGLNTVTLPGAPHRQYFRLRY